MRKSPNQTVVKNRKNRGQTTFFHETSNTNFSNKKTWSVPYFFPYFFLGAFLNRAGLCLRLLLLVSIAPGLCLASDLKGDAELLSALRAGGYNLYFRHMATEWSQSDHIHKPGDWRSCDPARVRQLSPAGREQARAAGQAMRRLQIPVSEVLASPYCRTVETARLMDLGDVRETVEVMNLRAADFVGGRVQVVVTAQALLSRAPIGGNRVIVAHGNVAREATPAYPGEGEALVFEPRGDSEFELVGRIAVHDWSRLLAIDTE